MENSAIKRSLDPSSSFKRRHPSSATFRILCPDDTTGGVIGKGGAIIRQFREETGAKIRIEDAVPGSEDRVIVIVADAHTKKWNDGGSEYEASPAQWALARVFERILRVDEERAREGEDKGTQGPVQCRLLAPSGQVGCVLGKGGRIVEKIRQESGAQIRVLGAREQQLPPCASAGDELIHITGSFSSVRKALLYVSSCLQDNARTEPTSFSTTSPFAANVRGVAPPTGDPYAQRSFMPSPRAPDYHPRTYLSNPGMDLMTSGLIKVPAEEVMFRILCSNDKVGSIIGKAGAVIRALQSETGASIKVLDAISDSDEKIVVISARENADLKHSPAQEAILRVHSRFADSGHDKEPVVSARLLVPMQQIGCLLGKGGTIIAEMRRATGANIRIFVKEQVPNCARPNDEVVQVTGTFQSVQDALLHITGRIRETIFPSKPYASVGMNSYMSGAPDVPPPLLRSRIDSTPPGPYSTIGLSHRLDPSVGFPDPTDRQSPFSHGVHRIGTDRTPFFYGAESSGKQPTFDHSSSPRSWTPQAFSSGIPRGTPDAGMSLSFRSGITGSGSQTAIVTSTTVRVAVPQHLLGFVYGEDGNNLAEIREISGAKVTIFDPKAGETEGMVIISGSPDQSRMAQSLLHAFIFCGQESS